MVIVDLKLNKILGFDDISINFTYIRKTKNNPIGVENLKGIKSFNYKKVNLIMGSNSSGKTSLGRVLWNIMRFLKDKEAQSVIYLMPEQVFESKIRMDYVVQYNERYLINRLFILMNRDKTNPEKVDIKADIQSIQLREGDTYASVSKLLPNEPKYMDYIECLSKYDYGIGWNIAMPITEKGFDKLNFALKEDEVEEYRGVMEKVLKTLDPNIKSVGISNDSKKAFVIKYDDGKTVIAQDQQVISDLPYFSSGTKYGFRIAHILYGIKKHKNGIYYVDELFSYVNSDIEVVSLSTMIQMLGDDEQLFFTSHNSEIMNLNLPLHSFSFLGKKNIDGKPTITFITASEFEKRNNVVIKNLYDNDIFGIAPSTSLIFDLGEDNE
ncbi:MAG: ATP-binding protein [Bacilli bacterium]|nr:ATP-binding protein [Bacilli bacterium]